MAKKNQLSSPFELPHPMPNVDGDKRDIHDKLPTIPVRHDRSRSTSANVFIEGEDGGHGRIGPVDEVAADVLSSPQGGQRRSATGKYESVRSVPPKS